MAVSDSELTFTRDSDGVFIMVCPHRDILFRLTDARRERDGLTGILRVSTHQTFVQATREGVVRAGKINLQSPTTVQTWVNALNAAWDTPKGGDVLLPWAHWFTELQEYVDRRLAMGTPPVLLSEEPLPPPMAVTCLPGGLPTLDHHPMLIAADAEVGKSTLAVWMAGHLIAMGHQVLYVDWETDQDTIHLLLYRLFGEERPPLHYYHARPGGPIWDQAEGLKTTIRLHNITYAIFDSVGFAISGSDGPESAAAANRYYATVAALGPRLGSLHLAHISKVEKAKEGEALRAPTAFGSVYWHNGARIAYGARSDDDDGESSTRTLSLMRTKGGLLSKRRVPHLAYAFTYDDTAADDCGAILVTPVDLTEHPVLSRQLTIGQRIVAAIRAAPLGTASVDELQEELDPEGGTEAATRVRAHLSKLQRKGVVVNIASTVGGRGQGGRWALASRRVE